MSKYPKQAMAEAKRATTATPRPKESIAEDCTRLMQAIGGRVYSVSQFGSGALTFSGELGQLLSQLDICDREAGARAKLDAKVAAKEHLEAVADLPSPGQEPYEAREMTPEEVDAYLHDPDSPASGTELSPAEVKELRTQQAAAQPGEV